MMPEFEVLWLLRLYVTVHLIWLVKSEECMEAQKNCQSSMGCNSALKNYMRNCGRLIHGETTVCDMQCKIALISLLSTQDHEGLNFMSCDCGNNHYCRVQTARIQVCKDYVLSAMKNIYDKNSDISCSLSEAICQADTSCSSALSYYFKNCHEMWEGRSCTHSCNNSLTVLYLQAKARKLQTCLCDGSEMYNCERIKDNTQKLCHLRTRNGPKGPATTEPNHKAGEPTYSIVTSKNTGTRKPHPNCSRTLHSSCHIWQFVVITVMTVNHIVRSTHQ